MLCCLKEREPNASDHPIIQPVPPALHLSAIQWDTGSCWDTSLLQDGCRVMSSSSSQSAGLYRCRGGDRLKEDATVSTRASFIRKIQNVYPGLPLYFLSHCNIYIHGGTSHPFLSAISLPFHLFPFSSSIIPTSRLCAQLSTQTLTATRAFKAQTALHLSHRGGGGGDGGERGRGTRAFSSSKTFMAAEMRGWFMVNIEHLRLKKDDETALCCRC